EEVLVTENGLPRELAFFRFEGRDNPVRPQPLPLGEFTNRAEFTPGPARNVTAIVLDAINVSENRQASVREDLMRYLDALPPGTRAALFRLGSQLKVLHDFTEDVESLRASIKESKPEIEMAAAKAEAEAAEARALAYFNQAGLEAIGNHLAGVIGTNLRVFWSTFFRSSGRLLLMAFQSFTTAGIYP